MSRPLAERVRPRRFSQVLGQTRILAVLSSWLHEGRRESLILAGEGGAGKTTLACLYAEALLCAAERASSRSTIAPDAMGGACHNDACRACRYFRAGRMHPNLRLLTGGDDEVAARISEDCDTTALGDGNGVVLVERAERLTPLALDRLDRAIDRANVTFILCTQRPETLPGKLRRCWPTLTVEAATVEDRLAYLRRLEAAVPVAIDEAARTLLAQEGGPELDALARDVSLLASRGVITDAAAHAHLRPAVVSPVLAYLSALLADEPISIQEAALRDWHAAPAAKISALEVFLVSLFRGGVLALPAAAGCACTLDEKERLRLVEGLRARGEALGAPPRAFWQTMIDHWRPDPAATPATWWARVIGFDALVRDPLQPRRPSRKAATQNRPPRRHGRLYTRAEKGSAGGNTPQQSGTAYLAREEAQRLWDGAAFMVQQYGTLFNARFVLRYDRLGMTDPTQAAEFLTSLTHETRLHIGRRAKAAGVPLAFSWAYVHEYRDGRALRTTLVAHLQKEAHDVIRWLRESFAVRKLGAGADWSGLRIILNQSHLADEMAWHLKQLRFLTRGLEPAARGSDAASRKGSGRLIDTLGVAPKLQSWRISGCHRGRESVGIGRVAGGQRYGISRDIDQDARQAAAAAGLPFVSAWELGVPTASLHDHDRAEHRLRRDASATELKAIAARYAGGTAKEAVALQAALNRFASQWSRAAEARLRNLEG